MPVPRVFVSFASEDKDWKDNFTQAERFGGMMGTNVQVIDYQMGDNLPFGPLNEWLRDEVDVAAAVVCIVSRDYVRKKYTLREWWTAIDEIKKRKLIFVPVMIDAEAREWWKEQKSDGKLRELSEDGDYAYANFTNANGRRLSIVTEFGTVDAVTQKIRELARLIGHHLQMQGSAEAVEPPEPDERQVEPGDAPEDRSNDRSIVILGHPSSVPTDPVARNTERLVEALTAESLVPACWKDGWREMQGDSHGPTALLRNKPILVQPVGSIEAGDHLRTPTLLGDWLGQAVTAEGAEPAADMAHCDLTIWLPEELKNPAFDRAAAAQAKGARPALKHDNPAALAHWLGGAVRGARPVVAVLTLEELYNVENASALRAALHGGFNELVGEVIKPTPQRYVFSGEMLIRQLNALDTDRVIVAIHDLNTGTAQEFREAWSELEQKLGAISVAVEQAARAQTRKLKLFMAALLVAKADKLPFVKYPSPSRFENWCLLPFAEIGAALRPKPVEADMFRMYLREWAAVT